MNLNISNAPSISRAISEGRATPQNVPDPIKKSFSHGELQKLISNPFKEETSTHLIKRSCPSLSTEGPSGKLSICIPPEHIPSMYTLRSELIRESLTVQLLDNFPPYPIKHLAEGAFSEVYTLINPMDYAQVFQEIPNDQIVIKILHLQHCTKLDPDRQCKGILTDSCITMIKTAVEQHQKLFNIFKFREERNIPLTKFYNIDLALSCGYSVYEKVIPIQDAPTTIIWDSNILFENLSDTQKITYNSILELILIEKLLKNLTSLIENFAYIFPPGNKRETYLDIANNYALYLDLKWNNFGFRQNPENKFQLVLIDDVNVPPEYGIEGRSYCINSRCSGPTNLPNPSIKSAFSRQDIATLSGNPNKDAPYYEFLNASIGLLNKIQNISYELDQMKSFDESAFRLLNSELFALLDKVNLIIS